MPDQVGHDVGRQELLSVEALYGKGGEALAGGFLVAVVDFGPLAKVCGYNHSKACPYVFPGASAGPFHNKIILQPTALEYLRIKCLQQIPSCEGSSTKTGLKRARTGGNAVPEYKNGPKTCASRKTVWEYVKKCLTCTAF